MGEKTTFPSNSHSCEGYLTPPINGQGPALVVIQEWWGLVPHIENLVDRFAASGYLAMAPDLYHGKTTKSPNDAAKMMMEMDADRAVQEIIGAGRYLLSRPECSSKTFGVVGFCMGGALAQAVATRSREVGAAVSFYGGFKDVKIEWENLSAPLLLIYGESDQAVPASKGVELIRKLRGMGKEVRLMSYPDSDHAFFNDDRPEVHNPEAAEAAWNDTLLFLGQNLK